jgi:ATP-dependent protease ClpP protease subunit
VVEINSFGGSLTEGFAIHDFLRAQGLPVETIGSTVYSIATVILLAGDPGNRFMRPNGRFLVHNPMPAFGIQTDADGYRDLATLLEREEDELISFYRRKTGLSEDFLRNAMDKDESLPASQAIAAGFVDGIKETDTDIVIAKQAEGIPLVAKYIPGREFKALRETLINKQNSEKMEDKQTLMQKLVNLLSKENKVTNQSEPEAVETAPAVEEVVETTPSLEDRLLALTQRLEGLETAKAESESKVIDLQTQLEAKNTEIAEKDNVLEQTLEIVNKLQTEPVIKSQPSRPVPTVTNRKKTLPIPEALINQIKNKMR